MWLKAVAMTLGLGNGFGPSAYPSWGRHQASPVDQLQVSATIAADGRFSLALRPDSDWGGAEISVRGGGAHDVGPVNAGEVVEIAGWASTNGPMNVVIQVAAGEEQGETWWFEVDPEWVPVAPPQFEERRPSKKWGWFDRWRA